MVSKMAAKYLVKRMKYARGCQRKLANGTVSACPDAPNAASVIDAGSGTTFAEPLSELTIGAGVEVTFGDPLPPLVGGGKNVLASAPSGDLSGGAAQIVPEPGSAALLLGSLGVLLGRCRRGPR